MVTPAQELCCSVAEMEARMAARTKHEVTCINA